MTVAATDPSDVVLGDYQAPERRLAGGSLRFLGSVGMSIGIQAPTGGLVFIPVFMAQTVGAAGPLAFLLAILAMLPIAYVVGAFSKRYASAGSVYAFNGGTLSPIFGFATCFALLAVYVLYAGANVAAVGNDAQALLTAHGVHLSWLIPATVGWALGWYLCFRNIHFSALFILALEGAALAVIIVVGIVVMAKGGYGGHRLSLSPFKSHGLPVNTLLIGLALAYTGFSGFEGAATVGEEAQLPRRIIPGAVIASLIFSGLAYVFGSYVETIGYPSATALSKADVPMVTVAHQFLSPWVGTLVNVAALLSILGGVLACMNAASRLLFAMSRDGFLSRRLAEAHPVQRSPYRAVAVVALLTALSYLALGKYPPLDVFFDTAELGVYLILIVYLITCVSGLVLAKRERDKRLGVVSLIGIVFLAVVIKYQISPAPAYPFTRLLLVAAVLLVLAFAIPVLTPSLRARLATSPLFVLARADGPDTDAGLRPALVR